MTANANKVPIVTYPMLIIEDSEYRDGIVLVQEMVARSRSSKARARAECGLDRGRSSSAWYTYTSTYLYKAHQLFISSKLILKEADRTKRRNK